MKHIARVLVFVMFVLQFNNISFASEQNKIEVSNGFVKYTVNRDNGRYSISTESGAAFRNDENQPLLFEEYIPDTSFTTFRINGEDYIYGNDYGFLGIDSYFKEQPSDMGLINKSAWVINGIEITQTLTLDTSELNAGNVKISYNVKNTTGQDVQMGSRILMDTMLGLNDGSPVSMPGNQAFIEKETELSGDGIPMYWKAVDQVFDTNVVSYGLISGWRNDNVMDAQEDFYNVDPDKMIIGHWEGLSKTKWDYDINPMLNFTSSNNSYGTSDSAVALYWDQQVLSANSERIYETYYGLGEYSTVESETPVDMKLFAPERLYLNETKDGYTKDTVTINGEVDNTLVGSQTLNNAKAKIEYTTGLSLPYGTSETVNLGEINTDITKSFSWELNTSLLYSWTYFKYKVTLTADNLAEPIVRSGDILIPSISGEPPEIKFTDYHPRNLYNLDNEKILTITGQNLDAISYGNNYRVVIKNNETKQEYVVNKENLTLSVTSIEINIPDSLGLSTDGLYEVCIEYVEDGESKSHVLSGDMTISSDKKYMIRKYGILLVVREETDEGYSYNIVNAKNEEELKELGDNESIILDIRADEIIKSGDVYMINSKTATINSIVTCTTDVSAGHDSMTIEKKSDLSYKYDYIYITGKGKLSIPGFVFQDGPYEISLVDETFYSVTDEDDSEDVVIKKPLVYKGMPVIDLLSITMQAFPISINDAILREKSITFGGSINLTSMLSAPSKITKKGKNPEGYVAKKVESNDEDSNEEDDDGMEGSLKIDDLRFGVDKGSVVLEGLKAEGSIGIPKNITKKIIPDCDLGAEIGVSIDTFDNWRFEVKADINFEVIQAKGDIVFKIFQMGGVPIPIPDTVIIYGGNKQPGIPLIPPAPVGFLTGLGGGFENLYDTVTLNFNVLPPLTLNAIASFQLFKVLEANEVQLKVSARGITMEAAELGVGPLKIFENVGMSLNIKDDLEYPGFEIKTYAGLNIMDWVTGEAYYLCSIDSAVKGNLGPVTIVGEANGSIQVPDEVFLIGGLEFGGAEIGISNQGIHSSLSIIGIPVSFDYDWGGKAAFRAFACMESNAYSYENRSVYSLGNNGVYHVDNYEENGDVTGTIFIGKNFHKMVKNRNMPVLASVSNDMFWLAAIDDKEHLFDIVDHDYSLIEVEYTGDEPVMHLYQPNGQEFILKKNENYIIQEAPAGSVDKTNKIFISIVNPENGQWSLSTSKNVTSDLFKVDAIPELTKVEAQLNGTDLSINWSGNKITDEKVNVVLCTDPDHDPGTIISTGLEASSSQASIQLPEDLVEGNYYVRLQLIRQDETVLNTIESTDKINYIDMNKPSEVTNLGISNIGNGLLNVTWNNPQEDVDGYMVDVIDKETEELVSYFNFAENTGKNIIGGTYNQLSSDSLGNAGGDSDKSGMIPGREYRVLVSSYKIVNNIKHYSDQVTQSATINTPNPADIQYGVSSMSGQIIDKGMDNQVQTYLTNKKDINLNLDCDQQVDWEVRVNDEVVYKDTSFNTSVDIHLPLGKTNISIKTVNVKGDISQDGFTISLDEEPPVLRIDSPKQGELVNESVIIMGFVDLNSKLKINDEDIQYTDDGLFNYELSMNGKMIQAVNVEAIDEAGNKSEYFAEVYNNKIEDIKEIKIQPNTNYLSVGDEVDYDVMLVDINNNEFLVDDSLIKWSVLNDYGVLEFDYEGNVRAQLQGKDVLIASYYISKDYAFQDAVTIEVVNEMKNTESIIVNPNLIKLKPNESYTLNVYDLFDDSSSRILDNESLKFEVVSGDDFIDLSSVGEITAIKNGEAIVSVSYIKNGLTFEADVIIKVVNNSSVEHSSKLSAADKLIINVYKNIKNKDGSITIAINTYNLNSKTKQVKATVPSENIVDAFNNAIENKEGKKKIIIEFPNEIGINGYQIDLPKVALQSDDKKEIILKTALGSITLPANMLGEKCSGNADNVSIVFKNADLYQLDGDMKDKIGDKPIIELSILENGEIKPWENKNAPVTISIPYVPKAAELKSPEHIVIWHIDSKGNVVTIPNSRYDKESGVVTFTSTHFSYFAVAYVEKNFGDINCVDWARKSIEVMASKGIINGTSAMTYSPKDNITRADYLVLLVKTLGLTADFEHNFDDVTKDTYYYETIGIAKKLGIAAGSGNNLFNPKEYISRQDMIVLTEKALVKFKALKAASDITLLNKFSDKGSIAEYAMKSMENLIKEGLILGYENKLNPHAYTTRAEVAVFLYKIYNKY